MEYILSDYNCKLWTSNPEISLICKITCESHYDELGYETVTSMQWGRVLIKSMTYIHLKKTNDTKVCSYVFINIVFAVLVSWLITYHILFVDVYCINVQCVLIPKILNTYLVHPCSMYNGPFFMSLAASVNLQLR